MMRRAIIACLVMVAIVCIAVALYYPISYYMQLNRVEQDTEQLKALKPESTSEESSAQADLITQAAPTPSPVPQSPGEASSAAETPLQTANSEISAQLTGAPALATPVPEPTATPEPTQAPEEHLRGY